MSLTAALLLALQVSVNVERQRDSVQGQVSVRLPSTPKVEVTEAMRRSAFRDPMARELLLKARAARLVQDSTLYSYDVKSYQRVSVGMALRETARDRLMFRTENASRVRWQRGVGARIEVLGARTAVPIVQGIRDAEEDLEDEPDLDDMFAIPYYPGMDELWLFRMVGSSEEGNVLIHPIAEGSEAYFTFAIGDSVRVDLPDGTSLSLRELRVIPREARWNLLVGSLWFEVSRANLVRAVLRFSAPMNIWEVAKKEEPDFDEDVPAFVKPIMTPMRADLTALTIEYGLHEQRFWLPRVQGAEFWARVGLMRMPIKVEQRYRYESVNAFDSLTAIPTVPRFDYDSLRDSLRGAGLDSAAVRRAVRERYRLRDSTQKADRAAQCATKGSYTTYQSRYEEARLALAVEVPCDRDKLWHSPELPPSIYDAGEELFGATEREELLKALDFGLQPAWGVQRPTFEYGLSFTRFNRIEGLSSGVASELALGKGYTAGLTARASLADAQLNGEFGLSRSNGRRVVRGTVYRRLVPSHDFGDPYTVGASLDALLFGRDEGFYHRAWGVELSGARPLRGGLEWRLFGEEQWSADVESRWSLFGGANDPSLGPNVVAERGRIAGAALRWRGSRGLDPAGWRLQGDVRLEGAGGDFEYARGLIETTVSRGLGRAAASVTAAVGTSTGDLPSQRHFFLGGLHSVRGQEPGTGVGEAFWMGRLEIGTNVAAARPVIFGDLGWAGPRDGWGRDQRPMAGVGAGVSFLDGMIRVDLARGIYPEWNTRFGLYFEARF